MRAFPGLRLVSVRNKNPNFKNAYENKNSMSRIPKLKETPKGKKNKMNV